MEEIMSGKQDQLCFLCFTATELKNDQIFNDWKHLASVTFINWRESAIETLIWKEECLQNSIYTELCFHFTGWKRQCTHMSVSWILYLRYQMLVEWQLCGRSEREAMSCSICTTTDKIKLHCKVLCDLLLLRVPSVIPLFRDTAGT